MELSLKNYVNFKPVDTEDETTDPIFKIRGYNVVSKIKIGP